MPQLLGGPELKPASEGQDGERFIDSNGLEVVSFTEVYEVRADHVDQTDDDIIQQTPNVPGLGASKRGATLKRKTAKERNTAALLWELKLEWDSRVALSESQGGSGSPIDQVRWGWSSETEDVLVPADRVTGGAITNSAKEPILITEPMEVPVLEVVRMMEVFSPDIILNYSSHVNSAPFWGAPAGCALLTSPTDQEARAVINGRHLREVTFRIKFRFFRFPDVWILRWPGQQVLQNPSDSPILLGWQRLLLDQGKRRISDNYAGGSEEAQPSDYVPFLDSHGKPTTGNLNGGGFANTSSKPVYLLYNTRESVDLNNLNLGPF